MPPKCSGETDGALAFPFQKGKIEKKEEVMGPKQAKSQQGKSHRILSLKKTQCVNMSMNMLGNIFQSITLSMPRKEGVGGDMVSPFKDRD